MIDIVLSLYERPSGEYSKYVGIVMTSVMANTASEVHFFILHNETLTEASRQKLNALADKLGRCQLDFCFVEIPEETLVGAPKRATKGHFFRLKIPEVLPQTVERLIYLDADIVVNMDVAELWELPIEGNLLLARLDWPTNRNQIIKSGVIPHDQYINSGVMVMDVRGMRQRHDFFKEALAFFREYPVPKRTFCEQDAVNYVFRGEIGHLEPRFNLFTMKLRDGTEQWEGDQPCIYHFAGDHVWLPGRYEWDMLYMRYLSQTPWSRWAEKFWRDRQAVQDSAMKRLAGLCDRLCRESILQRTLGQATVFWGIAGKVHETVMPLLQPKAGDFFVDNSVKEARRLSNGFLVCNPDVLLDCSPGEIFIVVLSGSYAAIRGQLQRYGYREGIDFVDGRELLKCDRLHRILDDYERDATRDVDGFLK